MRPEVDKNQIVLGSGSRARRQMLAAAGLSFVVETSNINEPSIRADTLATDSTMAPARLAQLLARAKALDVSARHPDSTVIGGDQILAMAGEIITKPRSIEAARDTLVRLRGRMHELHSAVAVANKEEITFTHVATARLLMRNFSDEFLDDYLRRVGSEVQQSVGAYQLEALGVQLFEEIEGDYFTILGMPLLPLLRELRKRGLVGA